MEMLVGMEDGRGDAARGRAGSCVEFYSVRVSLFFLIRGWGGGDNQHVINLACLLRNRSFNRIIECLLHLFHTLVASLKF